MANPIDQKRRLFLQALGMGATGLALGGGASWLYGELTGGQPAAGIPARSLQLTDVPEVNPQLTALEGQLGQLNQLLGTATGENEQLALLLKASQDENLRLKTQISELQGQVTDSQNRLSETTHVLSLYEQLEAVGIDGLAQSGLASFAAALAATVGLLPGAATGIATARTLIEQFEAQLPDLNGSVAWLADRVLHLKLGLFSLETSANALAGVAAGGVSAAFGGFAKYIIDYLPFDIGRKIKDAIASMQGLVDHNATLSEGVDQQVFEKLSPHFSEGPANLKVKLLEPVRTQGLQPAGDLVNSVSQTDASYQSTLAGPLKTAIDQRALLRQQIQEARAKLG